MIFLVNKFINSKDRGKIFLKYESIRNIYLFSSILAALAPLTFFK